MTSPLSRIRSMTSARPLGLGARWTPDAPLVVSAVLLMPLLPAAFPRRFASVRKRPQLLLEDALERDFEDPPPDFDELDRPPDFAELDRPPDFAELDFPPDLDELDRPRLDDRDDDPPPDPRLRLELCFPDAALDFD